MMAERWEHFPHGADVGVRGMGPSPDAAFAQAALALTAAVADPAEVEPATAVEVACAAPDLELLLVDWLNALVYEMATRDMLFARFEVSIERASEGAGEGARLTARAWGEPVDAARHDLVVEAKGATYTALAVSEEDGEWTAQCVIDV